MDPYEEVAQQGQEAPPSPAYVPDPMELEHHVPVYVPEHVYPEYLVPSDDDIPIEDPEEDPKEDPINYAADADDDKDEEEESFEDDDDEEEEHLAPADPTAVASPAVDLVLFAKETESFETDESTATPPPPPAYRTTSRISVRTRTHIPFPSEIPSPPLPLPSPPTHTSPTYAEAPLGYRAVGIRLRAASPLPLPTPSLPLLLPSTARRAGIPEADIPPRKRLLLIAPTPRFEVGESSTTVAARHPGSLWLGDRAALRDEVDTLRRYLSSLCITHEQERVEARQALARSEAHNRALETRIVVLETQAYHHEWQRQDEDDHAYWKHHAYPSGEIAQEAMLLSLKSASLLTAVLKQWRVAQKASCFILSSELLTSELLTGELLQRGLFRFNKVQYVLESFNDLSAEGKEDGNVVGSDVRWKIQCELSRKTISENNSRGNGGRLGLLWRAHSTECQGQSDFKIHTTSRKGFILNAKPTANVQYWIEEQSLFLERVPLHRPCSWQNLTSEDSNYDEAGPSMTRITLFEVQVIDTFEDIWLNKTKWVWKATGKLFADIGYQWRPTGKKYSVGKLDCSYQWRPTERNWLPRVEMCPYPLTKLSVKFVKGHPLVSDSGVQKHMTGISFKAHEFCEKFIGSVRSSEECHLEPSWIGD
ncbi:hypothetical protein Tco_1194837 [Tanacetum coccineum]